MIDQETEYIKTSDIARHYNVSKDTVRNWIKANRFDGVINVGTDKRPTYRIPRDSVLARRVAPPPAEVVDYMSLGPIK